MKKEELEIALLANGYNVKRTAEQLGKSRTWIYDKFKEFKIKIDPNRKWWKEAKNNG